jgi:hypothetical protein
MILSLADVQIIPSTSHSSPPQGYCCFCPPFTSQEDNDWLSDLRYGHTKISNLEPQEDESRSCIITKFLSLFRGQQVKKL